MIKFLQFVTLSTVFLSTDIFSASPSDIDMMTDRQAWHAAKSSADKNKRLTAELEAKNEKITTLQRQINDQRSLFIVGSLAHKAHEAAHKEAEARQELTHVLEQLAAEQARVAQLTEDLEAAQARIAKLETHPLPTFSPKHVAPTVDPTSPSKVTVTRTTVVEMLFAGKTVAPTASDSPLQEHGQVPPPGSSFGRASASDGIVGMSPDDVFEDDDSVPREKAKRSAAERSNSGEGEENTKRQRPLSRGEKAALTRKKNAREKAARGSQPITGFFPIALHNSNDGEVE